MLLGAAIYRRTDAGWYWWRAVGSGSCALRARLDATVIDPPSQPDDARVVIARTDAVATIHRPARMLCVCVRPPGTGLEYRFVGLLGSAAYRESVFAIPVLADRATEVLELSGRDRCTVTPAGPSRTWSRRCRATWCSNSTPTSLPNSSSTSSGCRSAASCGSSTSPNLSGRGPRCSCTCPALGSRRRCPTRSRHSWPITTAVRCATRRPSSERVRSPGSR